MCQARSLAGVAFAILAWAAPARSQDAFSSAQWAIVSPLSGWTFVAADVSGDSRSDLIGYHPSNGTLWVGVSSGTSFQFVHWKTVTPAADWSFAAGDFAGDARNLVRARGEPSRLIGGSPYSPAQGASLRAER